MKAKTALKAGPPGKGRLLGALVLLAAVVSLPGTSSARADKPLRLAYVCGQHICSIRSDGKDRRRLTDRRGVVDGSPAWSPDGSRLAFTRFPISDNGTAGFESIYIWRRADNAFIRLRKGSAPAWSPDGRRLAYQGPRGISIMTRGGTVLRAGLADGHAPTWSPTGESLAYLEPICARPEPAPEAVGDSPARAASPVCHPEKRQLWAMTANGDNKRRLADSVSATSPPDWSPRGDEIVFSDSPSDSITVLRLGDARRRTIAEGYAPAWAPGGGHLAFATGGKNPRIIVTDRNGKARCTVTRGVDPDWHPRP